ncbi:MAG: hypothetical protein CUN56_00165 [Phototrophicales bacterium]|nr:MAG: hypothetical protein CUN56_00165 [Phototrophicales bacterium]
MPIETSLATDIGKVRLFIGDTTDGKGVKPDGSNFTDAEITAFLNMEDNSVHKATAAAFEALSAMWAALAGSHKTGPQSDTNDQAAQYAFLAKMYREEYGYTADKAAGFSAKVMAV